MTDKTEWRAQTDYAKRPDINAWDVVEIVRKKGDWEEVRFVAIAQNEADAHLIAAAREMQEGLENLLFGVPLLNSMEPKRLPKPALP